GASAQHRSSRRCAGRGSGAQAEHPARESLAGRHRESRVRDAREHRSDHSEPARRGDRGAISGRSRGATHGQRFAPKLRPRRADQRADPRGRFSSRACRVPHRESRRFVEGEEMKRLLPLVLLLTACSFFSKTKSTIYSLDRVPGTVVNKAGTPIAIGAVELPPGFDRKEVVVRKANSQLDIRQTQQWSATLGQLVTHTL